MDHLLDYLKETQTPDMEGLKYAFNKDTQSAINDAIAETLLSEIVAPLKDLPEEARLDTLQASYAYSKKCSKYDTTTACIEHGNTRSTEIEYAGWLLERNRLDTKIRVHSQAVAKGVITILKINQARDMALRAKRQKEIQESGDAPHPYCQPLQFINHYLDQVDVSVSGIITCRGEEVPQWITRVNPNLRTTDNIDIELLNGCLREARRVYNSSLDDEEADAKFLLKEIHAPDVDMIIEAKRKGSRNDIANMFPYTGENDTIFRTFLERFNAKGDHDLHVDMLKHWIWQVKRRLLGLDTKYEIMIAFLGAQGVGKSYAADKFLKALPADIYGQATVSDLLDERNSKRWERIHIVLLDEISRESKDSLAKLKDWITKRELDYRPMRTNSMERVQKNAQGIATTNFPLGYILRDSSGMRRFWTIHSDNKANHTCEGLDAIDYTEMYNYVDESREKGYYNPDHPRYEEICALQNDSRDKTPIEEFLYKERYVNNEGNLYPESRVARTTMKVEDLLWDCNSYLNSNNWRKYDPKAFFNELVNMNLPIRKHKREDVVTLMKPGEEWPE